MNVLNALEVGILHRLNDIISCDFLDLVMPIVTHLGDAGFIWIVLALILICFKKTRKAGMSMGIALVLGLIIGNLTLKPLVARVRPYDFDTSIMLLIPKESDLSFPSGHTLASFEGAFALFLRHRRAGIFAIVLAFMIAFSRLYLMVHYPSDVICGMVLGVILAYVATKITDKISKRYITE